MKCGVPSCTKQAVWLHTYYSSLSMCGEHYKKQAARELGKSVSPAKTEAARANGKKGGRPKNPQPS